MSRTPEASEETERSGVPQRSFTCRNGSEIKMEVVGPPGPAWERF